MTGNRWNPDMTDERMARIDWHLAKTVKSCQKTRKKGVMSQIKYKASLASGQKNGFLGITFSLPGSFSSHFGLKTGCYQPPHANPAKFSGPNPMLYFPVFEGSGTEKALI